MSYLRQRERERERERERNNAHNIYNHVVSQLDELLCPDFH